MDIRNWKALFMVISIGVSSAKEPDWSCDFELDKCGIIEMKGTWNRSVPGQEGKLQPDLSGFVHVGDTAIFSIPYKFSSSEGFLYFEYLSAGANDNALTVTVCQGDILPALTLGGTHSLNSTLVPYSCANETDVQIRFIATRGTIHLAIGVDNIKIFQKPIAVHVGQCYILKDNPKAIATPSYQGQTVSSNGCVGDIDSNIHVLAMTFEPPGLSKFGFSDDLRQNVTVRVTSRIDQQEKRPIVLVLASVTPVQLTVIIDRGVTLEKILWSSMLLYNGISFLIEPDAVHQKPPIFVEVLPDSIANIGNGSPFDPRSDDRDHTTEFLDYVRQTYGCDVASFTGTNKKVDAWLLTINGGPNIGVKKDTSEDRIQSESSGNRGFFYSKLTSEKETFVFIDKADNTKQWIFILNVAVILLFLLLKRKTI